jgi:predicted DNA-binding transcriptional regulator YafY
LEQSNSIPGEEYLDPLYKAIEDEKALQITYKKFQDPKLYSTVISPYLLKEYNQRWYLIACKHEKKELRTYGLERIQNINPSFKDYIKQDDFDPNTYFKDIIGITKWGKVERVVFKVYKTDLYTVDYIRTRPLHHSQRETKTAKDYSVFTMDIIPNREFEFQILSYGDFLEILEPEEVREKIRDRFIKAVNKYSF